MDDVRGAPAVALPYEAAIANLRRCQSTLAYNSTASSNSRRYPSPALHLLPPELPATQQIALACALCASR